jgi:N-acetylmuramoyl-L-alanine amidase
MKRIVVDAGHGPKTAGKRSPDGVLREFTFNEAVAVKLGKLLSAEGYNVTFSHNNTRDVPLSERVSLANKLNADAFVSIHANAFGNTWNDAHGIETFTSLHPSETSVKLAICVQQSLFLLTGGKNRGVKKRDFAVLRETKMPAILVECGFMTNKKEAHLLKSTPYQKHCAQAIYFGLLCSLK